MQPVVATIQGLSPGENQTKNYNEIRCVVQDQAGNVWFPAYNLPKGQQGNLLKFDSRTKQFVGFRAGTHGLATGQFRSATVDSKGQLWLGYRGGGILLTFDPKKNEATNRMPTTNLDYRDVVKIVDDPARNVIWIARYMDGLWQYDRRKNTTRQVLNEPVLNIYLTKNKVLWLKTLTSIVRFKPQKGQLIRFGSEYDLHNFNYSPFSKTDDDEFFFEKFRFYKKRHQA